MDERREELLKELADPEYRHAYAEESIDLILARQIRALRKQRGLTQKQLADATGTGQSFISEIEDEDYGSLSLKTLKELARAFDVFLNVRFDSFKVMIDGEDRVSMAELEVPTFDEDPSIHVTTSETLNWGITSALQNVQTYDMSWAGDYTGLGLLASNLRKGTGHWETFHGWEKFLYSATWKVDSEESPLSSSKAA